MHLTSCAIIVPNLTPAKLTSSDHPLLPCIFLACATLLCVPEVIRYKYPGRNGWKQIADLVNQKQGFADTLPCRVRGTACRAGTALQGGEMGCVDEHRASKQSTHSERCSGDIAAARLADALATEEPRRTRVGTPVASLKQYTRNTQVGCGPYPWAASVCFTHTCSRKMVPCLSVYIRITKDLEPGISPQMR